MSGRTAISGLYALSYAFLACAAAFMVVIGVYSHEGWAIASRQWTRDTAVPNLETAMRAVDESVLHPFGAWVMRESRAAIEWAAPGTFPAPPVEPGLTARPIPRPTPPLKVAHAAEARKLAKDAEALTDEDEALPPTVDPHPPTAAEIAKVERHLRESLSRDLFENFRLFLYVSKAEAGPWAQRMYAYDKAANGDLQLLYSWPVSTGREQHETNSRGVKLYTQTPPGFYQLDGGRMHKHYLSMQWQHPMPFTMFFKWEKDGMPTGLAIHSAYGADDIARLGNRASAGCVRLAPRNAQVLFKLVREHYRGLVPLFAYDAKTHTIHNDGLLMRDDAGKLEFVKGYQVLVFIENYGGDNIVAALF